MQATQDPTLRALIGAYRTVLLYEGLPNCFQLAKLFPELDWSRGGLVLLGVSAEGDVLGVPQADIDLIYSRLGHLCAELTPTRVEIGTLRMDEKIVIFLVFNTVPAHRKPLEPYASSIYDRAMV